jgi:hypothetical protein
VFVPEKSFQAGLIFAGKAMSLPRVTPVLAILYLARKSYWNKPFTLFCSAPLPLLQIKLECLSHLPEKSFQTGIFAGKAMSLPLVLHSCLQMLDLAGKAYQELAF